MASLREQMRIKRFGIKHNFLREMYYIIFTMSWLQFFFVFTLVYALINCGFAGLYSLDPNGVSNIQKGSFFDLFVFSSQTFSTVGYGFFLPTTTYIHWVVIFESMSGILFTAIITGLTFAKFSRPTTHLIFSDKVVVANYDGLPHLMIRIGNGRDTSIIDAKISLVTLKEHISKEGLSMQRFVDLKLDRDQSPFFLLTWTVMHKIDENSPFYGYTQDDFHKKNINLFVSLMGHDETFAQTVHAGWRYSSQQIYFARKFEDVISLDSDGTRIINFNKFHEVIF
jgi:inward rectifier potassium channel